MAVSSVEVNELVRRVTDISGLPEVTQRVIAVINDENSDANELQNVLRQDPALVARVIRVANSAYYAQPTKIATIHNAVVLLGFDAIKNVALAASVAELFRGACELVGYSRAGLWEHMVSVAAAARMIARRIRYDDAEEAFLAGMMHDIGIILLDQHLHEAFLESVTRSRKLGIPLARVERELFGFDHAYVGARLARAWNFPPAVRLAAAYHHEPDKAGEEGILLATLVHLSDVLAKTHQRLPMGDHGKAILHADTLRVLEFQPMDIRVLHQDLVEELQSVHDFYQLLCVE